MSEQPAGAEGIPDVSVIVPAYNAAATIRSTLGTIAEQRGDFTAEIIVVDDGSTDGTMEIVEAFEGLPFPLTTFAQENSGWAGSPRNRGLERASGRYVLFVDADDALRPGAIADLLAFADEHQSDVVIPKMVSSRRRLHADVFEQTLVEATVARASRNNFVFKLWRRELIENLRLRFEERPMRLEDAEFCFTVYAAAARISILCCRELYEIDAFDKDEHISSRRVEPGPYEESVGRSLTALRSGGAAPGEDDDIDTAVADFFRRVILTRFNDSFHRRGRAEKAEWFAVSRRLALKFASHPAIWEKYGPVNRARLAALLAGDQVGLHGAARRQTRSPFAFARVTEVVGSSLAVELAPALGSSEVRTASLVVGEGPDSYELPLRLHESAADEVLGTRRAGAAVRIGAAGLSRERRRVHIVCVDEQGRTVRTRLCIPRGVELPSPSTLSAVRLSRSWSDGCMVEVLGSAERVRRAVRGIGRRVLRR